MRQMISPAEARQIVLEQTGVLQAESIPHADALNRVLARDISSDLELPPFDNSAMDGYAVCAQDLISASHNSPVELKVLEIIGAGQIATQKVRSGACLKIMTGAPVPDGSDAVVMHEETEIAPSGVLFFSPVKARQNIRPRGDDIKMGERVLEKGSLVRASEWAMLASLGRTQVEVFRAPRVVIITTGDELVAMEAELLPGQIRDSNSFALEGLCKSVGAKTERIRVGDDVSTVRQKLLEYSRSCDCIITSGGVSAGDFDPVRDALFEMEAANEAAIHFWKIAMKPGKPVMFASLTNPESGTRTPKLVFGLPGNPVSVMVTWEQFVRPALWKMQHRKECARIEVEAELTASLKSPEGKEEFIRAKVRQENSLWKADVAGDQSSGRLSTMTRANALLIVPAQTTRVEAGQKLRAQLTD